MHIFYYAAAKSAASERYIRKLRAMPGLEEVIVLPDGEMFKTPLAVRLRCGDLIILYAANEDELVELLRLREDCKEFRIIVVLRNCGNHSVRQAHRLRPCYISCNDNTTEEVESVIQKLTEAKRSCDSFWQEWIVL